MPADYVNKLARMFQDIKVSEDLNTEFKDTHRKNNETIAGRWNHLVVYTFLFLTENILESATQKEC